MATNNWNIEQLTNEMNEKKRLYNKMILENKEFEEVKTVFMEIKSLQNRLTLYTIAKPSVPDN